MPTQNTLSLEPENSLERINSLEPEDSPEPSTTAANRTAPIGQLLRESGLWRASSIDCEFRSGIPTGFDLLDQELPGNGWPVDGVTELLTRDEGFGELRLLMPALAKLSQEESRWLLWVNPPHIPYAPALTATGIDLTRIVIARPKTTQDMLWVIEKALASHSCSAVLAWPGNIQEKQVRRLQVASKEGGSWNVLFRPESAQRAASPAELRIRLFPVSPSPLDVSTRLGVQVLKRRGGWQSAEFELPLTDSLHVHTPRFPDLQVAMGRVQADPPDQAPTLTPEPGQAEQHEYKLQ